LDFGRGLGQRGAGNWKEWTAKVVKKRGGGEMTAWFGWGKDLLVENTVLQGLYKSPQGARQKTTLLVERTNGRENKKKKGGEVARI